MRSPRRTKAKKKPYKHQRINTKRNKRSKTNWDWNDSISCLFLDNINEILRQNKTRRAEGKGCWKIVPRDSCEVYKDRRKRLESNRRREQRNTDDTSFYTESQMDEDRYDKRRPQKKNTKKRVPPKKVHSKPKNKKRSSYTSSQSSYTMSSSSMSTSYSTRSEMEQE